MTIFIFDNISLARMAHLRKSGSALIGIIIVMLIFSALGAALLPMVGTASFGYAKGQTAEKAYYLAESGYRYLISRYQNAGNDIAKDLSLEGLNQRTFGLRDNQGKFGLTIYPFYFLVSDDPEGTTNLKVRIPGSLRSEEWTSGTFPSSGRLRIGQDFYDYSGGVDLSEPSNINFTTDQPLNDIEQDTAVLLVARSAGEDQAHIPNGGDLSLSGDTGDHFPLRNGQVLIDGRLYVYKENDKAGNRLVGMRILEDDDTSFSVGAGTNIILTKYVIIASTGRYGEIDLETERTVTYYASLPSKGIIETQEEIVETFSDENPPAEWETVWGGTGAHDVRSVDGNNALAVEGAEAAKGHEAASLIRFDWSANEVNLNDVRKYSGGYLSYDAQIKIGFEAEPLPEEGYGPEGTPIPRYYAAGLSFRLDENQNMYGISFLRGDSDEANPAAKFDLNIVPVPDTHLIVLWQATNNGLDRRWLAYKDLDHHLFYDDVESGEGIWTETPVDSPWERDECVYYFCDDHGWIWSDSPDEGQYIDKRIIRLTSAPIDISGLLCGAALEFWHWYDIHSSDSAYVEIKTDGNDWRRISGEYTGKAEAHIERIPIDTYLPAETIQLRFTLDSMDDTQVDDVSYGWVFDDIAIIYELPVNESTLLASVQEADVIGFINADPDRMKDGDWIVTGDNSGIAQIFGQPLIASRSEESANGRLMLIHVSGDFDVGDTLRIRNQNVGTVSSANIRSNMITAFYGRAGCDHAGNNTPLDFNERPNPRMQDFTSTGLRWPPEDLDQWREADDYFTLIQWDAVNSSGGATHNNVPFVLNIDGADTTVENAIIQSTESVLLTPATGEYTRPELALHTLGDGAGNIYFDDFGLRYTVGRRLAAPVQQ